MQTTRIVERQTALVERVLIAAQLFARFQTFDDFLFMIHPFVCCLKIVVFILRREAMLPCLLTRITAFKHTLIQKSSLQCDWPSLLFRNLFVLVVVKRCVAIAKEFVMTLFLLLIDAFRKPRDIAPVLFNACSDIAHVLMVLFLEEDLAVYFVFKLCQLFWPNESFLFKCGAHLDLSNALYHIAA